MLLTQLSPSHSIHMAGHTVLGVWQGVTQSLCLPCGQKGSSIPGCVSSSDTFNSQSVVGIKSGDSGVVIGYWVDEFIALGLWSDLLLDYTFILVSWSRYETSPLPA